MLNSEVVVVVVVVVVVPNIDVNIWDTCEQVTTGDLTKRDIDPRLLPRETTKGGTPGPAIFPPEAETLKRILTSGLESDSPKKTTCLLLVTKSDCLGNTFQM